MSVFLPNVSQRAEDWTLWNSLHFFVKHLKKKDGISVQNISISNYNDRYFPMNTGFLDAKESSFISRWSIFYHLRASFFWWWDPTKDKTILNFLLLCHLSIDICTRHGFENELCAQERNAIGITTSCGVHDGYLLWTDQQKISSDSRGPIFECFNGSTMDTHLCVYYYLEQQPDPKIEIQIILVWMK